MLEVTELTVSAIAVLFAVRRFAFLPHGASGSTGTIRTSGQKANSAPERHERGFGHVPRLVRYIATGTGPYEPPK